MLCAAALLVGLFIGAPLGIERLGWGVSLQPHAGWVLAATAAGLLLTMFLNHISSGVFYYHRQGFDFCIVTMGAALSSLSLQLMSETSLLNNMPPGLLSQLLASADWKQAPDGAISRDVSLLFFSSMFVVSLLLALVTSQIARAVVHPSNVGRNLIPDVLAILNYVLGVAALIGYLQMLLLGG